MATLTASDYRDIRDYVFRPGAGKEEIKSLATVPNETKTMQVFQASEDRTIAGFALFRADMESILGIAQNAASLELAKKYFTAFCAWKMTHM